MWKYIPKSEDAAIRLPDVPVCNTRDNHEPFELVEAPTFLERWALAHAASHFYSQLRKPR